MPGVTFLRGDLVELRPIECDDAAFLAGLVNDPRIRRYLGTADPLNRTQKRERIESLDDAEELQFVIAVDGEPVGSIGLYEPNETWGTTELGYMIDPDHWGEGYATDAVSQACRYAFAERRFEKVSASVYETNPASRRVLEKAGFTEEGRLRDEAFVEGDRVDLHRYGLLAEEWFEG
ncbi:GNAT family N-acetyltransferase [Natronococcus pandeyae]|uniref:GNAT family N-acetyltransferase n=1 Tax=Natronococcus pandeyae TaxID=2055836 RepID=A0A8J8TTI3_9EURY|nr:GNAT family protein [Natronococcus pandeyae]TYL39727.1 GNAT family N-acetyltransferase [Natronococcus pandeyae]